MLEKGMRGLLVIFCFWQMLSDGLGVFVIVPCLTGHLILYLGTSLFVKGKYEQFGKAIELMTLLVMGLWVHPCFLLLLALSLAEYSRSLQNRWILALILGGILYSWYRGQWTMPGGYWLIIGAIILVMWQHYETQKRLERLQKTKDDLNEEVIQTKKKLERLATHQIQTTYMVQIAERNKMAQKLHDKLGHTLAGNIMRLEATKLILEKDLPKGQMLIEQIADDLRLGMDDIRRTLRDIKPEQSEVGLHTVKEMLGQLESEGKVRTHLYFEGDLTEVSLLQWQVITENLRETLTNLRKYSTANQLVMRIGVYNKMIKVQFKDNGLVGGPIKMGMGMRGMEERMLAMGGKFLYHTEEGFEMIMLWER